ncbi:MAG: hypothetical protein M3308_03725 [Actinomycetota bacterium]|nr:hypothetical protein [Actinomycetota bacterium]
MNPRLAEIERAIFIYRSVSLYEHETETDLADVSGRIQAAEDTWYLVPESNMC